MNKLSEAKTISANDKKVTVERHSNKRCKITIEDEFFTNFHGETLNLTYAFTFRKNGKWVQVNGEQELTDYKVEVK